jgi:hypothetical protein
MGGNSQPFLNTTGAAFHFQEFLPGAGLLSGSLEGYGAQNRFQSGQNFLELRGTPWMGQYWTFTAGDFRVPGTLVEFPFNNIFNPEIDGRGFKIEATHGDTHYTFFLGEETLTAGSRVSYRIQTPQTVMGVSALRRVATHLQVGIRAMQFSASPQSIAANPYLFPQGRDVSLARTLAVQSLYTPVTRLKIYAEASLPAAGAGSTVTSLLAGAAWQSPMFSWKANYTSEGALYLPLAGYFAGDRQGPFAEARFHPSKKLEFYGSASQYHNNLEHDANLPFLSSANLSAGVSATLPGNLSASAGVSLVHFSELAAGQDPIASNNRQLNAALTRAIRRHTLHVEAREIQLGMTAASQRQRSWEAGDSYQRQHFSVGGTVRYQQVSGSEQLNSVFFRGMAQANLGRFTAYGNVEVGNDLANKTVFATDAYNTSVAGVGLRLSSSWNLQAEAFRNRLNLILNPESIFLLQNGGALTGLSPAAENLSATSQWSLFFRVTKQLRWGAGLPAENLDRIAATAIPLVGEVQGAVQVKALAGAASAEGVTVSLDGARTAITGANGYYRFQDVPEGAHDVALALAELPADYDPGGVQKTRIVVQPRHVARADLEVLPLVSVSGKLSGPEGAALDGIVIHMAPTGRYTTTGVDGSFAFHNVHEGNFEMTLDKTTLPENGELLSPVSVFAVVRLGASVAPVEYRIAIHSTPSKPIRKVLDKK